MPEEIIKPTPNCWTKTRMTQSLGRMPATIVLKLLAIITAFIVSREVMLQTIDSTIEKYVDWDNPIFQQ